MRNCWKAYKAYKTIEKLRKNKETLTRSLYFNVTDFIFFYSLLKMLKKYQEMRRRLSRNNLKCLND